MSDSAQPPSSSSDEVGPAPSSEFWERLFTRYVSLRKFTSIDKFLVRNFNWSMANFLFRHSYHEPGRVHRPPLLLETVGRKSGQRREVVLPYWPIDGQYVILGTLGGAPKDPQWVSNLRANPECVIRINRRPIPVVARIADAEERERLSAAGVNHIWLPAYQARARRHGREIPFVVLTPVTKTTREGA